MARFEVFIPAAPPALPMDMTLRVDADNWLAALKTGLTKLGGGQMATNILCDIKEDNSIHVTDPQTGKVFRIREMAAAEAAPTPPPAPEPSRKKTDPAIARADDVTMPNAPMPKPPPVDVDETTQPAAPAPAKAPPPARRPSSVANQVVELPRPAAPPPRTIGRKPEELDTEEVLAEIFERATEVAGKKRDEGLAFLLDLAMEKIKADSGAAFVATKSDDLAFAVARGPKAREVIKLGRTVPMGVGVVGFCAQESVALAVSDAQKDKRFHRAISDAVGYETRSILCAPISAHGRVFGALEVLNKKGSHFSEGDLAVLAYLAHEAGEFLAGNE